MIDKFSDLLYSNVSDSFKKNIQLVSQLESRKENGIIKYLDDFEIEDFLNKKRNGFYEKKPNNIFLKNELSYIINELGFRTWDKFDDKGDIIIFLGDSNTFGYGMYQEYTWPFKLFEFIRNKDKKDYKYWNIATPGASSETSFRILYQILKKYGKSINTIPYVFHFLPFHVRYERFLSNQNGESVEIVGPYNIEEYTNNINYLYNYTSDTSLSFSQIRSIYAIDGLLKKYNSKYNVTSFDYLYHKIEYFNNFMYENTLEDLSARDFAHLSYRDHHKIFSFFSKKL